MSTGTDHIVFWLDGENPDVGGRRPFVANLAKTREEAAKMLGERPGWCAVVEDGVEVVDVLGDAPTDLAKKDLHRRILSVWRELDEERRAPRVESPTRQEHAPATSSRSKHDATKPLGSPSEAPRKPEPTPRCAGHACRNERGEVRANTPELYIDLCHECRVKLRDVARHYSLTREAAREVIISGKRPVRTVSTVASLSTATPAPGDARETAVTIQSPAPPAPVTAPVIAARAPTAGVAPAEAVDRALRLAAALEAAGGVRGVEEATAALARCGGAAAAIEARETLNQCGGADRAVEAVTLVSDLGGAELARELAAFAASVGGAKTLIDVVRVVMEAAGA